MTTPTTPFHPTSAAIPKDGEYAGSYNCCGQNRDTYVVGDTAIVVWGDDRHDCVSFSTELQRDRELYEIAWSVIEAHRARKAKLAESPMMTRAEIIKKVEWTLAMTGPDMPYDRRAVQIVDAIHPELKPAPVKTPGEKHDGQRCTRQP